MFPFFIYKESISLVCFPIFLFFYLSFSASNSFSYFLWPFSLPGSSSSLGNKCSYWFSPRIIYAHHTIHKHAYIVCTVCINFVHSFQRGYLLSLSLSRLAFSFLAVLFAFGARLFTLRFPHCSPLQAFLRFLFSVFILIAMWPVRWALDQDFHSFISISYLFSVRFCNYLRFCRMLNCLCKYLTILHFDKAKAVQWFAAKGRHVAPLRPPNDPPVPPGTRTSCASHSRHSPIRCPWGVHAFCIRLFARLLVRLTANLSWPELKFHPLPVYTKSRKKIS